MADYVLTDRRHYLDIADAIREKNGTRTPYYPEDMAAAILDLNGSGSEYPAMELPEEYVEYVEYARENFYDNDYAVLAVWDAPEWLAVSFLMDDFYIEEYDPYTTEIKATGWITCGYTKATGEWTSHDYRNTVSPGENYVKNMVFASEKIEYGGQTLFPVGVMKGLVVDSVVFDDEAGTATVNLATGQTEVLTFVYDDSGKVNGVTVRGRTVTLGGV